MPAFGADKAIAIVEAELGRPVGDLFAAFERAPIAAASLGQVHRAVLHSGEVVAVKVQRPGLKQLFDIDLKNLRLLAEQLDRGDEDRDFKVGVIVVVVVVAFSCDFVWTQKHHRQHNKLSDTTTPTKPNQKKGIYDECAAVLYGELDYIGEGRSADLFRRNFSAGGVAWVRVPAVQWLYCSPRVLTTEYLPGLCKVSDAAAIAGAGLSAKLVVRRATESYLQQILRHGFFHADPHPGNVAVDEEGRLIYYDFGMTGRSEFFRLGWERGKTHLPKNQSLKSSHALPNKKTKKVPGDVRGRLIDVLGGIYRSDAGAVVEVIVADEGSLAAFGTNVLDPATRAPSLAEGRRQGAEAAERLRAVWR